MMQPYVIYYVPSYNALYNIVYNRICMSFYKALYITGYECPSEA